MSENTDLSLEEQYPDDAEFFADNPDPRCPVVVIIDSSSSMFVSRSGSTKTPMQSLDDGMDTLFAELQGDDTTRRRVALSFVVYGTEVQEPTPFAEVDAYMDGSNDLIPKLDNPMGRTSTGEAIIKALNHLEEYKSRLDSQGVQRYKAFVILLSDGLPTDDTTEASNMVKEFQKKDKLLFFPIGIEGADLDKLSSLSNTRALPIKPDSFSGFFQWLSASTSRMSASTPGPSGTDGGGQQVSFPPVDDWVAG